MKYKEFKNIDPYSDPWDRANDYFVKTETTPKWKKKLWIILASLGVLLCCLGLFAFAKIAIVQVPYLKGAGFEEVSDICDDLNLKNVKYTSTWNENYEKNTVISQNRFGYATIWTPVIFEMSMGVNPEETIVLTLKGKTVQDIEMTLEQLHYSDYTIKKAVSVDVPEGEMIGKNLVFSRNEKITLYVSVGSENVGVEITMPNFIGTNYADVQVWAKQNNININWSYEMSTYDSDIVFYQEIAAGTIVLTGSSMDMKVSKDKGWTLPEFKNMQEFKSWASNKKIKIVYNEFYSDSIPTGEIISISKKAGSTVQENSTLSVTASLGPVLAPTLSSVSNVKEYFEDINERLADDEKITVKVVMKESQEPINTIINSSVKPGQPVKLGSTFSITIAQPKKNKVKSQHDITVEELENYLTKLGMNLGTATYVESDLESGMVVSCTEGNFAVGSDINYEVSK